MSPRNLLKISGIGTLVWMDLQTPWCFWFCQVDLWHLFALHLCLLLSTGALHVALDVSYVSQVDMMFCLLTKSFVVGYML